MGRGTDTGSEVGGRCRGFGRASDNRICTASQTGTEARSLGRVPGGGLLSWRDGTPGGVARNHSEGDDMKDMDGIGRGMHDLANDPRFAGVEGFESKVWLSSPTMHGDEQRWVDEAIQTNWVSTVGANINEVEKQMAEYLGCKYAVGLSCGTASLHLATKLAGEKLYGQAKPNAGTLAGHKVFCSDVTFDASINPVAYEDGEAVFIDTERERRGTCLQRRWRRRLSYIRKLG